MSTPEDRLSELLRQQAESVVPRGDGLGVISRRIATRRRARWFVVPSAALVTAAAVGAFFLLGGSGAPSTLEVPGGTTTTPTASPSALPVSPTTEPSPTFVGSPFVPAIWPFASSAQADAWRADQSSRPWAGSNLGVAQHFVSDYLKLTGVHLVQGCVSCDVVEIRNADDRTVGTVVLVREDDGYPRAYSVAGVTFGDGFRVTAPAEGAKLPSPSTVRGTITGVDENVTIDLLNQAGAALGHTSAPAGSGQPWSADLTWTDDNWYTGALVLRTQSNKDGSLSRIVVTRVVRG